MRFADSDLQNRRGLSRGQEMFFREFDREGTKDIAMGHVPVRWLSVAFSRAPLKTASGLRHLPLLPEDLNSRLVPAADLDAIAVFTCPRPHGERGCPVRRHVGVLAPRWEDDLLVFGGSAGAIKREYDASSAPRHVLRYFTPEQRDGRLEAMVSGTFRAEIGPLWCDLILELRAGERFVAYRIPVEQKDLLVLAVAPGTVVLRDQLLAELLKPVSFGVGRLASRNRPRVSGTGDLLPAHREDLTEAVMTMVTRQNDLALGTLGLVGGGPPPRLLAAVSERQLAAAGSMSDGLENSQAVEDLLAGLSVHGDYYVRARHSGILTLPLSPVEGQPHLCEVQIGDQRQFVPHTAIPVSGIDGAHVRAGQPIAHACERTTMCSVTELEDLVGHLNARELVADFVRQSAFRYRDSRRGAATLVDLRYLGKRARGELSLEDLVVDLRESELVAGIALTSPISRIQMGGRYVELTSDLIVDFTPSYELPEPPEEELAPETEDAFLECSEATRRGAASQPRRE